MAATLQQWRKCNGLTQVEAASILGVSQPYLSLLEKGTRPLTVRLRSRMQSTGRAQRAESRDDRFRTDLSDLGYPGFAHISRTRRKPSPSALLLSVLSMPDADARVVDALPWIVENYAGKLDLPWLVRRAKLQNLQNRLGFLLQASGIQSPEFSSAIAELDRARLLREDTLCWDSMPVATREWMRSHRSSLAAHWNILTRLKAEDIDHVRRAG